MTHIYVNLPSRDFFRNGDLLTCAGLFLPSLTTLESDAQIEQRRRGCSPSSRALFWRIFGENESLLYSILRVKHNRQGTQGNQFYFTLYWNNKTRLKLGKCDYVYKKYIYSAMNDNVSAARP